MKKDAFLLLIGALVSVSPMTAKAEDAASCQKRYDALNDKYSALYIDLDTKCYPDGVYNVCGSNLSDECIAQYNALSTQSGSDYNSFYVECSEYFSVSEVATTGDPLLPGSIQKAPSKKQLLNRIQELKKQVRAGKKRNKQLKASCR